MAGEKCGLDCTEVNKRFNKLLSLPSKSGGPFLVFEKQSAFLGGSHTPFEIMSVVWQIRHSIVHNVGVLTQSDGKKLQILTQKIVRTPSLLRPSRDNIRHIEEFLTRMASDINWRCCQRLTEVLTELRKDKPGLFPRSPDKMKAVTRDFDLPATTDNSPASP